MLITKIQFMSAFFEAFEIFLTYTGNHRVARTFVSSKDTFFLFHCPSARQAHFQSRLKKYDDFRLIKVGKYL